MRNTEVDPRGRRALAAAALLAALLGGCSTVHSAAPQAAAPAPAAPCVTAEAIPAEPPMVGSKFNGDAKHDLQVLAPNARALREWGEQLRTMLEACAPKPAAAAAK